MDKTVNGNDEMYMNTKYANSLMSTAYNICNIHLATIFNSNDAAILISSLISKDNYFRKKSKKEKYKGWFFSTVEQIKRDTVCSDSTQRRLIKIFEQMNLLQIKLKGTPPKRHFKINYNTLDTLMSLKSSKIKDLNLVTNFNSSKSEDLNLQKVKNQILQKACHINYIQSNKIQEEKEKKKLKKEKFVISSNFEEVWKLYHKGTKSKALQAWLKICTLPKNSSKVSRPKFKEVKKAINAQFQSERWSKQPDLIPHTSTWLNGYRWLDDAEDLNEIIDFNKPKRNNSVGYQGGYKVTKESIKM